MSADTGPPAEGAAGPAEEEPSRLRRAECVLQSRLNNVTLVLEKFSNEMNQKAVLRTAEAMGVQHVYLVKPTLPKRPANKQKERAKNGTANEFEWGAGINVTSGCERWLSCKYFDTSAECIACLRSEGHAIWATDLSIHAVCLDNGFASSADCPETIPEKLALVMGSEAEGVTQEMLAVADLRVYLPMHGFTDSFNVGVAAALALSRVVDIVGRQPLGEAEARELRRSWIGLLSSNPTIAETLAKYVDSEVLPRPLDDLREGRANPEGPRIIKKVRRRQEEALRAQEAASASGGEAAAGAGAEAGPAKGGVVAAAAAAAAPRGGVFPAGSAVSCSPLSAALMSAAAAFAVGYAVGLRKSA